MLEGFKDKTRDGVFKWVTVKRVAGWRSIVMEWRSTVTRRQIEGREKRKGRRTEFQERRDKQSLKNKLWAIIVRNCSMRWSDRAMWRKDGGKDGEMVEMTERWWKWRRDGGNNGEMVEITERWWIWQGCGERQWRVGRAEEWGWNEWNDDKEAEWWWINDRDDE